MLACSMCKGCCGRLTSAAAFRWLGFLLAVMRKFREDHGGALTTVIAYNAFFALLCRWSW